MSSGSPTTRSAGRCGRRPSAYLRQAGRQGLGAREPIARPSTHLEQALGALAPSPRDPADDRAGHRYAPRPPQRTRAARRARRGERLHEAEGLARALGDPHRLGRISAFMLDQCLVHRRYDAAVRFGQEALSLARTLGDRATEVVATTFLAPDASLPGRVQRCGRLSSGTSVALEGDLRSRAFGTAWVHRRSGADLAEAFAELGRFDEAIEHGEVAVQIAETADHPMTLYLGLFSLGVAHLRRGDLPRATAILERCVDVYRTWQFVIMTYRSTARPSAPPTSSLAGRRRRSRWWRAPSRNSMVGGMTSDQRSSLCAPGRFTSPPGGSTRPAPRPSRPWRSAAGWGLGEARPTPSASSVSRVGMLCRGRGGLLSRGTGPGHRARHAPARRPLPPRPRDAG